jgi:hypothetical protein
VTAMSEQIDTPIEDVLIDIEWQGMVDASK